MKIFLSLFTILLFSNECDQKNPTSTNGTSQNDVQTNVTIIYEVQSRGFYEKLTVTDKIVSVADNREMENISTYTLTQSDWEALIKLKASINTKELPNLKSPTEKRFSDAAAIATLSFKTEDDLIKSSEFDHGHPPKEIEDMVNKLLSLKEKVQKQ